MQAQYQRFIDLVGRPPLFMNGHQHIHIFRSIAGILAQCLARHMPAAYVRRVREPWRLFLHVPGARIKRLVLSSVGRITSSAYDRIGCPGNDWVAGITDPVCVTDPQYFTRWLARVPGRIVELTCHPGYWDESLVGRDCEAGDGKAQRRVDELELMNQPSFIEACCRAGFRIASVSEVFGGQLGAMPRAA
jgi:predicted glycoside hydrolase/deacetylase ChbG (UPF0249 family)